MPLIARQGAFWESARETGWVTGVGRLGPMTALEQARLELSAIAKGLAEQYPKTNARRAGVGLNPVEDDITETSRPVLFLIAGAIGAVLVVALVNLINLLLAHGERRRREFAVRLALGANDARLRRQTGLESLMVAAAASALALAAAPVLVRAFRALYPADLPGATASALTPLQFWAALAGAGVCTMLLAWPQRRFTRLAAGDGALRASHRLTASQRGRRRADRRAVGAVGLAPGARHRLHPHAERPGGNHAGLQSARRTGVRPHAVAVEVRIGGRGRSVL